MVKFKTKLQKAWTVQHCVWPLTLMSSTLLELLNVTAAAACLEPITRAPETGTINGLHFFWRQFLVCVSCKSGTGFVWYQILAPIRTLFYSKPNVASTAFFYVSFSFDFFACNSCYYNCSSNCEFIVWAFNSIFSVVYFRCQTFSFYTHMEWKTGAEKWSWFMVPISGAYVMGLTAGLCVWNLLCMRMTIA